MAGFFSVRVAPGVRLSAGPRGLRAHLGPRAARLHVGGGGTGVSTGAGPFTYYQSLGGSHGRSRRGDRPRPTGTDRPPSPAALAKARRARDIAEVLLRLTRLHTAEYPPATPPVAPAPAVPPIASVVARAKRDAVRDIGWWHPVTRYRARRDAVPVGRRRHARLTAEATAEQQRRQAELDTWWQRLLANDEDVVLAELERRFADNEAPATACGVDGNEVTVAVLVPGIDIVPERMPGITDTGRTSLRRMKQTDRAEVYREVVAGYLLATVKEAFAAAPDTTSIAAVAVRDEGPDVYGNDRVRPLVAVRLTREALHGVQWDRATAWDVLDQAGQDLRADLHGRSGWPRPIDLADQPALRELTAAIDWDD